MTSHRGKPRSNARLAEDRRSGILEYVSQAGTASGAELARAFSVSAVTIHRDLQQLAEDGLVERVRGGARATGARATEPVTDWATRQGRAVAAKREMAQAARWLIEDGDTVFLDASTSSLALARELERRPPKALTIVTNSPAIVADVRFKHVHLIVTPGEVDQDVRCITGRWTEEFLSELNLSIAFVGGAALDLEHGLTTMQRRHSDANGAARAAASRTVALVDSTKFDERALVSIAMLGDLDLLITDSELAEDVAARYRAAGVHLAVGPEAIPDTGVGEREDDGAHGGSGSAAKAE